MPTKKKSTDHVGFRNNAMFCFHCGGSHKLQFPNEVDQFVKDSKAFTQLHKNCKKTWEEPKPDMTKSLPQRAAWWLEHGERGKSSEVLWKAMMSGTDVLIEKNHPLDPDDFRRCYLLLQAVPEWKDKIHRMKEVSPVWGKLADNWEQLTAMLEEQLATQKPNGMYELMEELGC